MGYYTHHRLETDDNKVGVHAVDISKLSRYDYLFEDDVKWYDHEIDMRTYSLKFPEVLFTLSCQGEELNDTYIEYYKNGLMQRCDAIVTFPEYSPELLT